MQTIFKVEKMLKVNLKNPELYINGGKPVRTKEWLQNITTDSEEAKIAYEVVRKGNLSLFEGSYNPDEPFSFDGGYHVKNLRKNGQNILIENIQLA